MAWTHFPVASGQVITAAMLNELRSACEERLMTSLPAELVVGQSLADVHAFITSLKAVIYSQSIFFHWVESWADIQDNSIWSITPGSTAGNPYRPKNLWELATGTYRTDWQYSTVSAAALNEMYTILNALRFRQLTGPTISLKTLARTGTSTSSCSAAASAADGGSASLGSLSVYQHFYDSYVSWGPGPPATYGASKKVGMMGHSLTIPADILDLYFWVHPNVYRERLEAGVRTFSPTNRELSLVGRYGSSLPSSWADSLTDGTAAGTCVFPSSTQEFGYKFCAMKVSGPHSQGSNVATWFAASVEMSLASSGLCSLGGGPYVLPFGATCSERVDLLSGFSSFLGAAFNIGLLDLEKVA